MADRYGARAANVPLVDDQLVVQVDARAVIDVQREYVVVGGLEVLGGSTVSVGVAGSGVLVGVPGNGVLDASGSGVAVALMGMLVVAGIVTSWVMASTGENPLLMPRPTIYSVPWKSSLGGNFIPTSLKLPSAEAWASPIFMNWLKDAPGV